MKLFRDGQNPAREHAAGVVGGQLAEARAQRAVLGKASEEAGLAVHVGRDSAVDRFIQRFNRSVIHALILLLCAAPAFAQVEVVAKYRAPYQAPLSADQKVALLRAVASEVHGGLLRKPDGTNCGGYSCDIVCFSDVTLFDVLQDQDNLALPRWDPTTNPRGYRCELMTGTVDVTTPLPPVQSPPIPVASIPSLDLTPIFSRLDTLYAQNERIYADLTNQHHDQTATLKAAIDSPAWYAKVFGNTYVQLALVSLGTYFTTHQAMK